MEVGERVQLRGVATDHRNFRFGRRVDAVFRFAGGRADHAFHVGVPGERDRFELSGKVLDFDLVGAAFVGDDPGLGRGRGRGERFEDRAAFLRRLVRWLAADRGDPVRRRRLVKHFVIAEQRALGNERAAQVWHRARLAECSLVARTDQGDDEDVFDLPRFRRRRRGFGFFRRFFFRFGFRFRRWFRRRFFRDEGRFGFGGGGEARFWRRRRFVADGFRRFFFGSGSAAGSTASTGVRSAARLWPRIEASGLASGWLVAAAATIAEVATTEEATRRPKRLPVSVAAAAIAARSRPRIQPLMRPPRSGPAASRTGRRSAPRGRRGRRSRGRARRRRRARVRAPARPPAARRRPAAARPPCG